uniref:Uncharacterized protein n=1 Tax=Aegilops tauschii subsp. strangulata TaxID=200361 RepID=A0A453JLH3_AEGTS
LVDDCVGEDMCLDYAGKDVDSGAILFYVVQLQSVDILRPSMMYRSPLSRLRLKQQPATRKGSQWELPLWTVSHVSYITRKPLISDAALRSS